MPSCFFHQLQVVNIWKHIEIDSFAYLQLVMLITIVSIFQPCGLYIQNIKQNVNYIITIKKRWHYTLAKKKTFWFDFLVRWIYCHLSVLHSVLYFSLYLIYFYSLFCIISIFNLKLTFFLSVFKSYCFLSVLNSPTLRQQSVLNSPILRQ